MDISSVMTQAHKNKKECSAPTVSRYNTNVKPAKKLPRPNVDPNAVKAFLDKKRKEETNGLKEAIKKKEELMKLRDATKTTKKANAMARRTKDNLKVYRGEDVLGLYEEPKKRRRTGSPPLSPEADRRHKAFMKNIVPWVKVPGINDDDSDGGYKEPMLKMDERKRKKMEKRREKARSSSNLEFSDLLQLAEKQKNKLDDSSSSSSEEEDSGEDSDGSTDKYGRRLTPEEKYQRERRKRRELEERLKMSASNKSQATSNNHTHKEKNDPPKGNLSNFKIGKLNSGMSEESKRAKVKALMEKLKQSSQSNKNDEQASSSKEKRRDNGAEKSTKAEKIRKSHSTPNLQSLREKDEKRLAKMKHAERDGRSSTSNGTKSPLPKHRKEPPPSKERTAPSAKHPLKPSSSLKERTFKPIKSQSELRQSEMSNHFKAVKRKAGETDRSSPSSSKVKREKTPISNPYKHTVVNQSGAKRPATDTLVDPWAKTAKGTKEGVNRKALPPAGGKCTLSVTSESVKTNYPGVAQLDPYIQSYKKTGKIIPKLTPEMVARYKAAIMRKMRQEGMGGKQPPPPPRRRYGVIGDESDEYDSELEDFIDDGEEEVDDGRVDVSSHIKAIFGYDKSKYGRESEWELSRMDASYKDIEKEEKRSLRIAREEDAREARLEEERMKKLSQKKKKK